jgi:RNA polymerase sigma-70 factor (ECF subfamily)
MTAIAYPMPNPMPMPNLTSQPNRTQPNRTQQTRPNTHTDVQAERAALERQEDIDLLAIIALGPDQRERAETALTRLYQKHSRNVYGLARRMVHDLAASEEIVQDVFMKLWQHAEQFDARRGSVGTWLMTIAHHASIDHLRRVTSRPVMYPEEPVLETIADAAQPQERLDGVLIGDAMRVLGLDERELIELAYFEGLTHTQIAARTRIPLGTIKTRIRSALLRLREHLESK